MKKIVCIGDSITYGYGVTKEQSWISLLNSNYSNIKFLNKGINGNCTSDMLLRSYEDILVLKPSYAIIMGGTNDFFSNYDVNTVSENLIFLCRECISHNINPILISPIPVLKDDAIKYWSEYINYDEVNKKLCLLQSTLENFASNNNILLIDLFDEYNSILSMESSKRKLYTDGVHPSSYGHTLIYKIIFDKIYHLF